MISYAQNFEDVMLRRVFRDHRNGFYIDIGAADPVIDSVTKFFYDEGWSGINIEPNEWFYRKLLQDRPRDINLNVAVGEYDEKRPFYVYEQYGISTLDECQLDKFKRRGFESEIKEAQVRTLAQLCREHVTHPIDFLKIDCEGWEAQVVQGADWDLFRPIVVVIEATTPGTSEPSWDTWEPLLTGPAQYEMVYFDGLNRFFLRHESAELRHYFGVPPNVFDEYVPFGTAKAEETNVRLQAEVQQLLKDVAEAKRVAGIFQEQRDQFWARASGLEAQVSANEQEVERLHKEVERLHKECEEFKQALLRTRLWVGQLSQELAAVRKRA